MGFVYAVLWCAQPPPLPYLARPASPACGYGYQDRRYSGEAPPPLATHTPFSTVRGHSGGSLRQPLIRRLWVWKLILDSDGDHFLFSPLFDKMPVSRYIDCCSWVKISEFYADADILSVSKFVKFSAWQASTISRYSTGESLPIKARRLEATPHLTTACKESNTIRET